MERTRPQMLDEARGRDHGHPLSVRVDIALPAKLALASNT